MNPTRPSPAEKISIEPYSSDKAKALTDLFYRSVHAIDPKLYSETDKEAWAPTPSDYWFWAKRLARKQPWLALIEGRIVGFMELEADGHIDCVYVDPDYQGRGVAKTLMNHILSIARANGTPSLTVEAAKSAQGFFAQMGFKPLHENRVTRNGRILINYTMKKRL